MKHHHTLLTHLLSNCILVEFYQGQSVVVVRTPSLLFWDPENVYITLFYICSSVCVVLSLCYSVFTDCVRGLVCGVVDELEYTRVGLPFSLRLKLLLTLSLRH